MVDWLTRPAATACGKGGGAALTQWQKSSPLCHADTLLRQIYGRLSSPMPHYPLLPSSHLRQIQVRLPGRLLDVDTCVDGARRTLCVAAAMQEEEKGRRGWESWVREESGLVINTRPLHAAAASPADAVGAEGLHVARVRQEERARHVELAAQHLHWGGAGACEC